MVWGLAMKKIGGLWSVAGGVFGDDPFCYEESERRLCGVMQDRAKINGKWLILGDEIEGFKVMQIQERCVILENENQEIKTICLEKTRRFF